MHSNALSLYSGAVRFERRSFTIWLITEGEEEAVVQRLAGLLQFLYTP